MNDREIDDSLSAVFSKCIVIKEQHLDVWRHTNNVCYIQWMQDIAVEHSEAVGWDSSRYLESKAIWVVRSHSINYCRSTYSGNKLLVQTWVPEIKKASCYRRYRFLLLPDDCDIEELEKTIRFVRFELFDFPKSVLVASAETHWAFVSTENNKPVKVFPELYKDFEQKPDITTYPTIW